MVILPLSLYVKKGKMGVNLQLKSRLRRSCDDVVNLVLISLCVRTGTGEQQSTETRSRRLGVPSHRRRE